MLLLSDRWKRLKFILAAIESDILDAAVCLTSGWLSYLAGPQDLIAELLPRVLPAITEGLRDLDDDVRAVAAAALIPVVDGLVQLQPAKVWAESEF